MKFEDNKLRNQFFCFCLLHVERRNGDSWLRKVRNLEIPGVSGRGRPRKNWEQVISEDLRVKGLQRKVAQNRAEWRSAIT